MEKEHLLQFLIFIVTLSCILSEIFELSDSKFIT